VIQEPPDNGRGVACGHAGSATREIIPPRLMVVRTMDVPPDATPYKLPACLGHSDARGANSVHLLIEPGFPIWPHFRCRRGGGRSRSSRRSARSPRPSHRRRSFSRSPGMCDPRFRVWSPWPWRSETPLPGRPVANALAPGAVLRLRSGATRVARCAQGSAQRAAASSSSRPAGARSSEHVG
jgi:hypothetical protein